MKPSLRGALLRGALATVILVLLLAGALLEWQVRRALWQGFDRSLLARARILMTIPEVTSKGLEVDFDEQSLFGPEGVAYGGFLAVQRADGTLAYASPHLSPEDLPAEAVSEARPLFRSYRRGGAYLRGVAIHFLPRVDLDEADPEDQEDARDTEVKAVPAPPDTTSPITLTLVQPTDSVRHLLARLRWILLCLGPATGVALSLMFSRVVDRALKPIDRLAQQLTTVGEGSGSLTEAPDLPSEIRPLVQRLNELICRLNSAIERERQFSADVAHELRTPLAGLRSLSEVTLGRDREPEDYQSSLHEMLDVIKELQGLIDRLLYMGRLDAGAIQPRRRPVDLGEAFDLTLKLLREPLAGREMQLDLQIPPRTIVEADPELLAVLLRNLLENAIIHGEARGSIWVSATPGTDWSFTIANSGSRVGPLEIPSLLERFTRGDEARSSPASHAGLGLPIAVRLAGVMGFGLSFEAERGGVFRARLGPKPQA